MRFDNSLPCDIPQMDLLSVPNTQSVVESGSWFLIPAEADFQTGSVIFKIQGDDCYIDLPETELLLTLSIRKIDNADDTKSTQIGGADRIGPVNDFISAIFSQIQVSINDVEVENSNESYPYRAYFENLLSYDKGSKTTFLQNGLFYKDEAGKMQAFDDEDKADNDPAKIKSKNPGYSQRRKIFIDGKSVELKGKLHSNIFNINRYMLSKTNIRVTLTRSRNNFCLMGSDKLGTYMVHISKAQLRVRKIKVNPEIALQHATGLENKNAMYPMKHVITKAISINEKSKDIIITNIHNGMLPNKVYVGFVKTSAYTGSVTTNPYNFEHFTVNEMLMKANGFNVPYNEPLVFDYAKGNYTQAYNTLYQGICEFPNDISMADYPRGYTIYAFNFSPDLCNHSHFHEVKTGSLSLSVKFAVETPVSIHAIFYLEFDNILQISKARIPIINAI